MQQITGEYLNRKWKVGARQSRFAEGGSFYMPLERFPGAVCDLHGYILFETREDYEQCQSLQRGVRLNIPNGISSVPGYVKVE